jgi:hypothetical protein
MALDDVVPVCGNIQSSRLTFQQEKHHEVEFLAAMTMHTALQMELYSIIDYAVQKKPVHSVFIPGSC